MVTGFTAVMELMKIVCKRLVYFGVSVPVKTGLLWFTLVLLCLQRLVYLGVLVYFGVSVPAKTGLLRYFSASKDWFTLVFLCLRSGGGIAVSVCFAA